MPPTRWEISLGSILQVIVLLLTAGGMYGTFSAKVDGYGKTINETSTATKRMEHYLSSQDREYWKKVAQNGDADK